MTRHDDKVRLHNMLEHAQEAVSFARGKNRRDLDSDRVLELALVRLVEVVGEAAVKTSPKCKRDYPFIPWAEIIGMRNRLIHGYNSIDLNIFWDTIEIDLPPLIEKRQEILVKSD